MLSSVRLLCLGGVMLVTGAPAAAERADIPRVDSVPIQLAHGGGLDRYGCHNDRIRGGYHCHRGGSRPARRIARPRTQPSPAVEGIQEMLAALGYDPGEADGLLGPNTRRAITRFERDTGRVVGSSSQAELNAALRSRLAATAAPDSMNEPVSSGATVSVGSPSQPVTPRGLGAWVTTADYPSVALRKGLEGVTEFRVTVDTNGRVTECIVEASSGHNLLDKETCESVERRAHFSPATGADGRPTIGTYSSRVRWEIPN